MNVLLVQPPDGPSTVESVDSTNRTADGITPPWELMCTQTYLQNHTRHISRFIDCRNMVDMETDLVSQINELSAPRVLVVNCPTLMLGQVAAVLEIAKRNFPTMRTVLCGAYPTEFPARVPDIPRVDFALAGDPEPILRNLLDYIDIEQRLARVPGLIIKHKTDVEPYFLSSLKSLTLPDWQNIYWGEYATGITTSICRTEVRLSRGNGRDPIDRPYGEASSPRRFWAMERLADVMQKCSHTEINEVQFTDPPGVWTHERLSKWAGLLANQRNAQPWSLRIAPMKLSDELIANLQLTRCRRLHVIFPTTDKSLFKRYGIETDLRGFYESMAKLAHTPIRLCTRFWIGGPEEPNGHVERISQMIRRLGYCEYIIEPFPLTLDSPLYAELQEAENPLPGLTEWIRWSIDPWQIERPVPLWGGRIQLDVIENDMKAVRKAIMRSPGHFFTQLARNMRSRNWIEVLEDKALELLQKRRT